MDEPGIIPDSSAEWLRLARAGNTKAFERLMEAHERQVFRTAMRLLGRREDAQDAAQEVFLKLYKNLNRIDEGRALAAWLYTVTVNVCRDLGRKRKIQILRPLEGMHLEAQPVALNEGPGALSLEQQRKVLASALESLTPRERAAVVLRDLEGLEMSEAARILGVAEVTVRSQLSVARLKLKRFTGKLFRRAP